MWRWAWQVCAGIVFVGVVCDFSSAQQPLTWQEVRAKFEAANPSVRAGLLSVDEARAQEVTAHLRPFAIVIVGGLIGALLLSIFLLPTLHDYVAREGDTLPAVEVEEM